ncbi:MAG: ribonuclease P protein component [Acidimicrobiales bacterium]
METSHLVADPATRARLASVTDRATFAALGRTRRARRGPLSVAWLAGRPGEAPRIAFSVSRKVGGAVVRNRIKRRLRAAMAESQTQLQPGAYLLAAGSEVATMPYSELRRLVTGLISHLQHRNPEQASLEPRRRLVSS